MKKFWIVLLAVGLVAGFAMSASAQTSVKFSGSYYLAGIYADNPSLKKIENTTKSTDAQAQALYYQRLRIQTEFKVAEGLLLVTRFDALEKKWGDTTWGGTTDGVNRTQIASGVRIQENLEWERAYIDMTTKIGRFMIGYQNFVAWGTMFGDTHITVPGIKYFVPVGPVTLMAAIEKRGDRNTTSGAQGTFPASGIAGGSTITDADNDVYDLAAIYKFGAGDAGLLYQFANLRTTRAAVPAASFSTQLNALLPYVKMKFGPVYFEAEALYGFGNLRKYDLGQPAGAKDITVEGAAALYLHAKADLGPAYVGGQFAWISGDDWGTPDKVEGSLATAFLLGDAFNPCLMLFSGEYGTWVGALHGYTNLITAAGGRNPITMATTGNNTYMDNVWFYQVYGGFKPTKDLDLMMSVTYAYADKKPRDQYGVAVSGTNPEFVSDVFGTEVDLVAKYKIFDNLEYQIGAAYLFTGDYFKGTSATNKIDNNYLLMHKLTLTF